MNRILADDVREGLPKRERCASKFDCGRALLICGSERYIGAPYFAAQAVVNTGCGLCYLSVPKTILPILGAKLNEPIFLPREEIELSCERYDAVLVGPGLSRSNEAEELSREIILGATCPTVVDADALYFLSKEPEMLKKAKGVRILTPHEGEFLRLVPEYSRDKREMFAEKFATENGCILVLKGADTIVASPNSIYVNTTGNCGMAKGGSGDVLSGVITSFIAQGVMPDVAARTAVYIHGLAGDLARDQFGTLGMTPTDTLNMLKRALIEV